MGNRGIGLCIKRLLCAVFLLAPMLALLPQQGHANSDVGGPAIRDTEIEHAMLKIARPMARSAGLEGRNIGVKLIINSNYNAYVIGDNNVYIHSGLLLGAKNMAEVAGVIAHEIGHLASYHVTRRREVARSAGSAAGLIALGAIAAAALAGNAEAGSAALGVTIASADNAGKIVLARSRQDEGVADEWAIRLMDEQMFPLAPLADAMRRIGNQRLLPEGRQSGYYRTHPAAHERSAVFQDHINRAKQAGRNDSEPQWMRDDFARVTAKLNAWTRPPRTTLANTPAPAPGAKDAAAINARFARAIAMHRLADTRGAIAAMAALTQDAPDDPFLREFYGDTLFAAGKPAEAAIQYERALAMLARDAKAKGGDGDASAINTGQIHLALGRAYLATDDPQYLNAAIATLEAANRLEPRWAFARRQLGISYGRAGRIAEADLTLAEEAFMTEKHDLAKHLASRAEQNPDASAEVKHRARDIIAQSEDS